MDLVVVTMMMVVVFMMMMAGAHMGQGPYRLGPMWAGAHMRRGPYGPGPICVYVYVYVLLGSSAGIISGSILCPQTNTCYQNLMFN